MNEKEPKTQKWQVMGESFELENRFKIVDYLGSGAYGVVCAVNDSFNNKVVAIKKCKKIFQSRTLAKRTLREVRLLRLFNHENIVKLKTILIPDDSITFTELYIVFELMETDLAQIIRSPQKLKEQHTQYFTYQLLQALKYLHSENVVHRDIKPRNILVNADCCLKLADFGLARVYNSTNDDRITVLTDYVTTRWYRAPEVIVGWPRYTSAVDMWAVGCIIAELIGRTPLFPGADTMKQMELISKIMGKPDEQFIKRCRKTAYRSYLHSLQTTKSHELLSILPYSSPLAMDLILNLLEYNPSMRFSAEEALNHAYIAEISGSIVADASPLVIPAEEFAYETQELTVDILRRELLREVQYHNPHYHYPGMGSSGLRLDDFTAHQYSVEASDEDLSHLQTLDLEGSNEQVGSDLYNQYRRQDNLSGVDSHQSRTGRGVDRSNHREGRSEGGQTVSYFNAIEAAGSEDVAAGESCKSGAVQHHDLAYTSSGPSAALSTSAADLARRQQEQRRKETTRNLTGGNREPTTRHSSSHSAGFKPPPPAQPVHSGPSIELHRMDGQRVLKPSPSTVLKPSNVFRAASATSSTTSFDSRTVTSDPRLRQAKTSNNLKGTRQAMSPNYPPPFNTRDSSTRRATQETGFFSCVRSNESDELEGGFRLDEDEDEREEHREEQKYSDVQNTNEGYSRSREQKVRSNRQTQHDKYDRRSVGTRGGEGGGGQQRDQHLPSSAAGNPTACVVC